MKRTCLIVTILASTGVFCAGQDKDLAKEIAAIRLNAESVAKSQLRGTDTEMSSFKLGFFSPIFYSKLDRLSLGAAARYEWTDLDFSDSTLFQENTLHSIDLPLFAYYEQTETLSWLMLFNTTAAGDFEKIDGDSFNYLAVLGARYKTSETFQWLLGAFYSTGFDDDLFLPAIGFAWEPSEQCQLLFAGPYARFKYSLSERLAWTIFSRPSGNRWNTRASYGERDLRIRRFLLGGSLDWKFKENNAIGVSAGWQVAGETEIKNANDTTILERDLESVPFLEVEYRYSF